MNKPWKNTQTSIELTSLLDVIFIVLMIVVCNQQIYTKTQVDEASAAVAEAEAMEQSLLEREEKARLDEETAGKALAEAEAMKAEAEDAIAEKDFYAEQLDTYDTMAEQMLAVAVLVDYEPADLKQRKIRFLVGTKEADSILLTPETAAEAWKEAERFLGALLQENKGIPVICAVSKTKILLRDERKAEELLKKLSETHGNLYMKMETVHE